MNHTIYQVDAFTDTPFAGNPAGVCILPEAADALWMQQVASEMNLSETAFLVARNEAKVAYDLRWFTPVTEVDLCGHATLAGAHTLWETGTVDAKAAITFHTLSGSLTTRQHTRGWIEMDFPAEPESEARAPSALLESLQTDPVYVGKNRLDYLVLLPDAQAVRSLTPDFTRMSTLGTRGVIVTAASDRAGYDFVSRYFAPAFGINEDPVTGSTHCCLGPFWYSRLGTDSLTGYQASPRGGTVRVRIAGDRVRLSGQAVTVMRAHLLI